MYLLTTNILRRLDSGNLGFFNQATETFADPFLNRFMIWGISMQAYDYDSPDI